MPHSPAGQAVDDEYVCDCDRTCAPPVSVFANDRKGSNLTLSLAETPTASPGNLTVGPDGRFTYWMPNGTRGNVTWCAWMGTGDKPGAGYGIAPPTVCGRLRTRGSAAAQDAAPQKGLRCQDSDRSSLWC